MSLKLLWNDLRSRRLRLHTPEQDAAPQPAPAAPARVPFKPNGHFYSPVIDVDQVIWEQDRIWRKPPQAFGVDFNREGHQRLLTGPFRELVADFDYPLEGPADGSVRDYYDNNCMFGGLDSRALYVMLRLKKPKRLVEVGSGFSSLLAADVNCRYLGGRCDVTCIEPYPQPYLLVERPGLTRLVVQRVQDVPDLHAQLEPGDILFIDSSHVSKTGSDVNYLFLDVLPRLAPGVIVHVHDIFLPFEYPKGWVFEGRSWNEQYLLQAMLAFTQSYKTLFACFFTYHWMHAQLSAAMSGAPLEGCSFWMEKTGPAATVTAG